MLTMIAMLFVASLTTHLCCADDIPTTTTNLNNLQTALKPLTDTILPDIAQQLQALSDAIAAMQNQQQQPIATAPQQLQKQANQSDKTITPVGPQLAATIKKMEQQKETRNDTANAFKTVPIPEDAQQQFATFSTMYTTTTDKTAALQTLFAAFEEKKALIGQYELLEKNASLQNKSHYNSTIATYKNAIATNMPLLLTFLQKQKIELNDEQKTLIIDLNEYIPKDKITAEYMLALLNFIDEQKIELSDQQIKNISSILKYLVNKKNILLNNIENREKEQTAITKILEHISTYGNIMTWSSHNFGGWGTPNEFKTIELAAPIHQSIHPNTFIIIENLKKLINQWNALEPVYTTELLRWGQDATEPTQQAVVACITYAQNIYDQMDKLDSIKGLQTQLQSNFIAILQRYNFPRKTTKS